MSQGGYTHTTRATGTVLTAAIYNADHQNHIINQNPQMTGGFSDTVTQMQIVSDPGTIGAENLSLTLADELSRIRFQLKAITGENQWYVPPSQALKNIGGIGDNSIPLTKLSNTTQGKLMGRLAAGVGPWQEFDIPSLTGLVPTAGDFVLGVPAAGGAPRKVDVKDIIPVSVLTQPQGRLTLQAATPVMVTNQSAVNTIRYTPYVGQHVPLWNGTLMVGQAMGGELTQSTTDNTKSPAACVANKNYDLFFWKDGTTPRISRGPPWTTDTTRGTGAGTTELTRLNGFLVNAAAITNGPAANFGTYIGTVRTNGSALVDFIYGGTAVGGSPAVFGVWNAYNRVPLISFVSDSTATWSYGTATWRAANASNNHRFSWVTGLQEDMFDFEYTVIADQTTTTAMVGLGFDSTTTPLDGMRTQNVLGSAGAAFNTGALQARSGLTALGFHFINALEIVQTPVSTFHSVGTNTKSGSFMRGMM